MTTFFRRLARNSHGLAALMGSLFALMLPATAEDHPVLTHHTFGNGPQKVMFLHSWLADEHTMDTVKPFLDTDKYTYAFPNLRGYGKSVGMTGEFSSTEAAEDMFRVADALNWDEFHLIGHSMSGMVVQRAVLIDEKSGKNRIRSVIGISPVTANGFPADKDTSAFLESTIHDVEKAKILVGQVLTGGRLPAKAVEMVVAHNHRTSSPTAMKGYFNMWMNEDFSADLMAAEIETPILVIAGGHDNPGFGLELYQETFGKWYPNVTLTEFQSAGHLAMLETPLLLVRTMEEFMDNAN